MRQDGYSCDICGAARKEANHWFVASEKEGFLQYMSWTVAERENLLDQEDAAHLCGQVCAHKLLDRFLRKQGSGIREQIDR